MPRNQFQRMVFAFLTVLVTVHGYVFYSFYVVNGSTLMQINDADSVLHAINAQGGVYMFGFEKTERNPILDSSLLAFNCF